MPTLSLYAGAGTSVNPSIENMTQTTPTEALAALKPEKSRTYEVGAKWDGLDGRLLLTGACSGSTRPMPARRASPASPRPCWTASSGWTASSSAPPAGSRRSWQLIAAYTYLDSEVRESNTPTEIGNRLGNVPDHSGTAVDDLRMPFGLEIGGGVRYVGERFTNVANTRPIDDYWLADATARL